MQNSKLTKEYLLWLFKYDKSKGILIWKNHWRNCTATNIKGKIAGTSFLDNRRKNPIEYRTIGINGKYYFLHQLVWFIEKNEWATLIDHVDGDGLNNRLSNLRVLTNRRNSQNRYYHRDKTKLVGTWWSKYHGKWRSEIKINGLKKHLGSFDNQLAAHKAYMAECRKNGF